MFDQKEHRKKPEVKEQRRLYAKEYISRPEVKAKQREYLKRPEVIKRRKEWRLKNPIKVKESNKKYYNNNKDKARKTQRRYNFENKDKINAWRRYKTKNDPQFNLGLRLRLRFLEALKHFSKTGKIKTSKQYGIDYEAIIKFLEPLPDNIHYYEIHHVKPLYQFDLNDPKQIKIAFAPENHELLTYEEHRKINHYEL